MLLCHNNTIWFGDNHVLRDLSCKIEQGDFIIILGVNGTGKTTFFNALSGKTPLTSGSIILDNNDITLLTEQQRSFFISRLFQNTSLNSVGPFTVAQNLAMALYSKRRARLTNGMHTLLKKNAEALIDTLGMQPSILDKPMNTLSGGQRQLISFAMATQHIPKLLLLDEPTAALDPQAATQLLLYAQTFIKQQNITTLLITHDPHIALSMGNKIWIIENGTITKQYNAEEKKNLQPDNLIGHINYKKLALQSL